MMYLIPNYRYIPAEKIYSLSMDWELHIPPKRKLKTYQPFSELFSFPTKNNLNKHAQSAEFEYTGKFIYHQRLTFSSTSTIINYMN